MLKGIVKSVIPANLWERMRRVRWRAEYSWKHSSESGSMANGIVPGVFSFVNRRSRTKELGQIYQKYREHTMIVEKTYIRNLVLASQQKEVDGCVVECGVWRGGMVAGIADVLGKERDYFLFDSFQGLPPVQPIDGKAAAAWQADKESRWYHDNCTASMSTAEEAMKMSSAQRVHIVPGWFEETLPLFKAPKPIALLRLDGDWYDSTMSCLSNLHKYMAKNGIIILDDYYTWDGCSCAVHDFLSGQGLTWRVRQLDDDVCYIRVS